MGGKRLTACVALSNDATVQKLNATYRGKNSPTNVLSFPAAEGTNNNQTGPVSLGDIVLAAGTVLHEARELAISPKHHLQHLVVHGLLHLLGFDHESDEDAEEMENLEIEIVASLGIANPYADVEDFASMPPRTARKDMRR
jgi:probable rRNA maturation factor